ncbi:unnamed protein product [Lactuca saligna]|uniref:PATROL1-like C-terminal domain-containing protein n=1 Tax=Lactuca saligna TaxID=75948 RepID=A0AA35V1Z3_LACSI|nr:unnamed protein product [Lactuca saligna]
MRMIYLDPEKESNEGEDVVVFLCLIDFSPFATTHGSHKKLCCPHHLLYQIPITPPSSIHQFSSPSATVLLYRCFLDVPVTNTGGRRRRWIGGTIPSAYTDGYEPRTKWIRTQSGYERIPNDSQIVNRYGVEIVPNRKDINAAIDRICEFIGTKIIFWDLRVPFIENLYRPSVSESRLETTLIEPLDVEPNQLCDISVEPLRDRIELKDFVPAAIDALEEVLLEPIEMTCDPTYLVNFVELYTVLASFQSHEGRVLNSLNGIKDMKSRLTSKAEYMLSGRKRMMWDISLINIKIIIPWENGKSEIHKLVLGLIAVTFSSNHDVSCFAPDINVPSQFMRNLIDDNSSSELLEGTQIQDLYDLLEIKLVDFQINLFVPFYPTYYFPILENLNASSALALCIFQDESLLKAMEVILTNATTIPFEVRFDIPFGVSPKILDPVYPGHKFPLPLHLAELGRIRWRPLGNTYWNIISYRV